MSHELCSRLGCGWICEPAGKAGFLFWVIGGGFVVYALSRASAAIGTRPMVITLAVVLVAVAVLIVNAIRGAVASSRYGAAVAYATTSHDVDELGQADETDHVADEGWVAWAEGQPARVVALQQQAGTACLDCGDRLEPGVPRRCDDCEEELVQEAEEAEAYDAARAVR